MDGYGRGTPLRVLALTNMWPTTHAPAYGTFVASQMGSVADLGAQVHVLFVDGRSGSGAYTRGAHRIRSLVRDGSRWDVVHAHTGHCAAIALLQRRVPVVISYVGYDLYGDLRRDGRPSTKSALEMRLFRRLGWAAAATITKSKELEERLPKRLRRRNHVLPNGVDRSLFRPIPQVEARARLGWPQDELTVLFAADPRVPRKRYTLAHEASHRVSQELPDVRLRVCSGVSHEEVPLWMAAADVLLLTSLREGSPNVVKEALACDLPVVASAAGDVATLLEGVRHCHTLPVDAAVGEFSAALTDVLRRGHARSNGRARTSHLALEVVAAQLLDIYGSVSRRSPCAAPPLLPTLEIVGASGTRRRTGPVRTMRARARP
jgi:teichuronic acid biosynthesis glycosyltransferase TuaC